MTDLKSTKTFSNSRVSQINTKLQSPNSPVLQKVLSVLDLVLGASNSNDSVL